MKKIFIILGVLASFQTNIETRTLISASDFKNSASTTLDQTFTISTAGVYVLTENIVSAASSGRIIQISASNVTLDLNGFTLSGPGASGSARGIEVDSSQTNIVIKNGVITSIPGAGIYVNTSASGVRIEDLTLRSCNSSNIANIATIHIPGTNVGKITSCVIKNCSISNMSSSSTGMLGIYATYTDNLIVDGTSVNNIVSTSGQAKGIHIENSEFVQVLNSKAALIEGSSDTAGVMLITCTAPVVQHCTSSGNISSSSFGVGFYFNDSNASLIEGCVANNNGGSDNTNQYGAGFWMISCRGNQCLNSRASGNYTIATGATVAFAVGFGVVKDDNKSYPQGCLFKDCVASAQDNLGNGTEEVRVAGFMLEGSRNCVIEHCLAFGNEGRGSQGIGFYLRELNGEWQNERCIIANCRSFSNTSDNATNDNAGYGIRDSSEIADNNHNAFWENLLMLNADRDTETPHNFATPDSAGTLTTADHTSYVLAATDAFGMNISVDVG